jgi:tetratricopeptide (TPR) repeat protein
MGVQLELAISEGEGLETWLARELPPRQAIELRLALGRFDEALELLQRAQTGGALDAVQSRHLNLKILREAGRGDAALALVDRFLAETGAEAGPLRLVRARVLLELGRLEEAGAALDALEAAPPAALNLIALHQTRALLHLLAGRGAEARVAADAARRIYPTAPNEVEESWGPAVYLAAPVEELPGIAYGWTRFPRLRDNDRRFHTGMRALLEGDRAKARSELEACIACSVGGEYPRRLAEAALRLPALQP